MISECTSLDDKEDKVKVGALAQALYESILKAMVCLAGHHAQLKVFREENERGIMS